MTIDYYNFKNLKRNKILQYVFLIGSFSGLGLMVSGVGSDSSFFERWEVPIWGYFLKTAMIIILFIMYLNTLFSPLKSNGSIYFETDRVVIKNNNILQVPFSEIDQLNLSPYYQYGEIEKNKRNRKIEIVWNNHSSFFDVLLSENEEETINQIKNKINR